MFLLTGDYGSVFSLVTNTELQPVKTLMSHALVCTVHKFHFTTLQNCQCFIVFCIACCLRWPNTVLKCLCLIHHFFFNYLCLGTGFLQGQPQKGKVCFDTMATGLVELCLFEKSPVIRIAHYEFT